MVLTAPPTFTLRKKYWRRCLWFALAELGFVALVLALVSVACSGTGRRALTLQGLISGVLAVYYVLFIRVALAEFRKNPDHRRRSRWFLLASVAFAFLSVAAFFAMHFVAQREDHGFWQMVLVVVWLVAFYWLPRSADRVFAENARRKAREEKAEGALNP